MLVFGAIVMLLGLQNTVGLAAGNPSQAMIALPSPEAGIAPGWLAFHPDAPLNFSNMSQHSLRLSPISPYYPQIAYGGDHLYYAFLDAGGWHTETADAAWSVGSGAALALDAGGKAHISYYDATDSNLKYATNKSGMWVSQTVVSAGSVGLYSDIAIDLWGDPAIVYFNATTSTLHYIYYDSDYGGWGPDQTVAAATNPFHTGWFSLALDTSVTPNRPHVSYYERASSAKGYLEWAHYNASSVWIHQSVNSCVPESTECRIGEYNSIALDPVNHQPAIAFSFYDILFTDTLVYTAYDGTKWVDDWYAPASVPTDISLAIDSASLPYISWSEGGFQYARRDTSGTWSKTTLDASFSAGRWSSLALVGTLAKVVHYDPANGTYKYIGHERSSWLAPVTVATKGGDVGSCTSLKVDGLGRAHISYFDNTSHALLYARYNNDGSWFKNTIDSSGTASCFSVMGINPATNDPSVAFIRGGSLWYSTGTTWFSPNQIDTGVTNTPFDYQSFSLALASDGTPHFVYRKISDLWYTFWTGSSWSRTQLVTGSVGSHVALALGPDNRPHIAYYQSGALKYTRYNGSWLTETITSNGATGSGTGVALAVDQSGQPMAAFMNNVGMELRVSTRLCLPVCSWTSPLLVDGNAEEEFSLALDRNGTPHLAALAWIAGDYRLDYITRRSGVWSAQLLDSNNLVGRYPSISLTPSGAPRISYYDFSNGDLKFALKLDSLFLPLIVR
jgi:hypothetical protein